MSLQRFNNVISLSRRYLIDPQCVDDVCYTLFNMFKDESVSIVYEKPMCSHIFVIGSNFEIKLFISASHELHLNIVFDLINPFSISAVQLIHKLFNNLDKTFSKFCKSFGDVQISLRATFKINHINMDKLMLFLTGLGIVIEAREKHYIDNITIAVIRGKAVGKHLKVYSITITLLYDDVSEITFTIDSGVEIDDSIVSQIIEMQSFLYNAVEYLFNHANNSA